MKNNVSHICFSLVGIGIFTFYCLVLDFIIVGSFFIVCCYIVTDVKINFRDIRAIAR